MKNQLTIVLIIFLGLLPIGRVALAYVAESSNYRLESDSINFGGGEMSSSASYSLSDTFGEVGTGESSSSNYNLHAGYRAMEVGAGGAGVEAISLSSPSDISLSEISSSDGGSSSGSGTWTVVTTNGDGYELTVRSGTEPALKSNNSQFSDYAPSGSAPDFSWLTDLDGAIFGFTAEGNDIATRYKDNTSACGTGSSDTTDACWDGLSTSDRAVASRSSATSGSGSDTVMKFKAEIGSDSDLAAGSYEANIIVTATTL